MNHTPFSKRNAKAVREKRLEVSLSRKVRGRIRKTMEAHSESYAHQPYPGDNWTEWTSTLEDTEQQLCQLQGVDRLKAFDYEAKTRKETSLAGFMDGAYPAEVFDAVEIFIRELSPEGQVGFAMDLNQLLAEEETPWRVLDQIVVKLDPSVLDSGMIDEAVQTMRALNLEGALDEFRDAVTELTGGDPRDAIQDACNAYESVLKVATGKNGDASTLINGFLDEHLGDIPPDRRKAMKSVFQALPILGNNLGRHGQGADVVVVQQRYAQLAVHLSGAFILFIVEGLSRTSNGSLQPEKARVVDPSTVHGPDDPPF